MPNIGPVELIIILVIALLVIGPGKLPDVGSALGKSIREFRKAATDVQDSVKLDVPPEAPAAPAAPAGPSLRACRRPSLRRPWPPRPSRRWPPRPSRRWLRRQPRQPRRQARTSPRRSPSRPGPRQPR